MSGGLMVAAPRSGSSKTTVALGFMAAFSARGVASMRAELLAQVEAVAG